MVFHQNGEDIRKRVSFPWPIVEDQDKGQKQNGDQSHPVGKTPSGNEDHSACLMDFIQNFFFQRERSFRTRCPLLQGMTNLDHEIQLILAADTGFQVLFHLSSLRIIEFPV